MPQFSQTSRNRLKTCHPNLQYLFNAVVQDFDCTILKGHRGKEEQNAAYARGASHLQWPHGKHNKTPSIAVDVAPYPIPEKWGSPGPDHLYTNDEMKVRARFYYFAGYVKGMARSMNIKIRYGGDWNGNHEFRDQGFDDLVHFELVEDF